MAGRVREDFLIKANRQRSVTTPVEQVQIVVVADLRRIENLLREEVDGAARLFERSFVVFGEHAK